MRRFLQHQILVVPRRGQVEWIGTHPHFEATGRDALLGHLLAWVALGGDRYVAPVAIDGEVLDYLSTLTPLAPLHQPVNLEPIRALARLNPGLTQVACFDTAFHGSNPPLARLFGLLRALTDEGVRRYGFHGLPYECIASELPG